MNVFTTQRLYIRFKRMLPVLLFSMADPALAQESGDHQYTAEAIQSGYTVYSQQCVLCHGRQGDTVDGIDLKNGSFRGARSDSDLEAIILNGAAEGRMPAFDLLDSELNSLIAYIRAGFDADGASVSIGDPVRGKEIFNGKGGCSDCHRVAGYGPRTAPDLSYIGASRTPASLERNIVDPAAALLPINRAVRLVTRYEETVIGRRLNEDTYTVQLVDSNGRLRSFRKSDLVTFEISQQPSKLPTVLPEDEVADLVGYLLTLTGL
jgi:putative heme-binding domain-containing protein